MREGVPHAILRASVISYRPTKVNYPRGEYQIMIIFFEVHLDRD